MDETRVGVELSPFFAQPERNSVKIAQRVPLLHYSTHSSFLLSSRIREVDVTLQIPSAHP